MTFKNLQEILSSQLPPGVMKSSAEEIVVWLDDTPKEKSKCHLPLTLDFLAYVLHRIDAGAEPYEICPELDYGINKIDPSVDLSSYTEEANKIRRYFQNKHLMRRLKNQEMSEWMLKVERITDNPNQLSEDCVRVIVKLPHFYRENKVVDGVFKDAELITHSGHTILKRREFVCQATYDRKSIAEKEFRLLFKDENKRVLTLALKESELGIPLWKNLFKPGLRVIIGGEAHVHFLPGQDVNSYQLGKNYEIEIIDK